jgi:hypothetical protein
MAYTNWQHSGDPGPDHATCSPNLELLRTHLIKVAGGQHLGCFVRRPIPNTTRWSSHAFGAAIDWGYGARHNGPGRAVALGVVLPWLIANHKALGIQQIHDYAAGRYWQNWRGWVERPPGQGAHDSFHIETSSHAWGDITPLTKRRLTPLLIKQTFPKYPGRPLRQGSNGKNVELMQERLIALQYRPGPVDGWFGPMTDRAVRAFQRDSSPPVDGIVGPITWAALFPR